MTRQSQASLWLAALLVAAVVALSLQGSRGLFEPDEGRYANVALQMLESGDYLTPRLNSEDAHFAKPPLTYWAMAASVALIGWTEWAVRLPNALVLTVLLVARLGRHFVPQAPAWPALLYATMLGPVVFANIAGPDTLLVLWEALSMAFAAPLVLGEAARPRLTGALMWAAWALAFMTKGPPGLLPLAATAALLASRGERGRLRALFDPMGLSVFAVVGLSWYVVQAALRQPELARYFLADEVYARIFTAKFDRNADALGPLRAYGPMILLAPLPWSVLCLPGFRRRLRTLASRAFWRSAPIRPAWLAAWILLPLAAFVLARSRLPQYLLPLGVPVALAVGRATVEHLPVWRPRLVPKLLLVGWIGVLLGLKLFAARIEHPKDDRAIAARLTQDFDAAHVDELVFVESPPYYGLRLYLRREIDIARLPALPHHARAAERASELCAELRPGERQMFLVPPALRGDFRRAVQACSERHAIAQGRMGRHMLYITGPPDEWHVAERLRR